MSVEYIDPDKRPVPAKEYEIQSYGTVVVEYMGRRERVVVQPGQSPAEQDLTSALVKVLNPTEKRVYFLAGHGEKDPTNTERGGYSAIIDALRQDNYQWEKLIIAQTNAIPENATVLILAGPKTDLIEGEVELIRQYPDGKARQAARAARPAGRLQEAGAAAASRSAASRSGASTPLQPWSSTSAV